MMCEHEFIFIPIKRGDIVEQIGFCKHCGKTESEIDLESKLTASEQALAEERGKREYAEAQAKAVAKIYDDTADKLLKTITEYTALRSFCDRLCDSEREARSGLKKLKAQAAISTQTIASLKRQLQAMRNCSNCEKAKSQFSSCPLCRGLDLAEWEPDKKIVIAGKITEGNEGFVESINAQGRELLNAATGGETTIRVKAEDVLSKGFWRAIEESCINQGKPPAAKDTAYESAKSYAELNKKINGKRKKTINIDFPEGIDEIDDVFLCGVKYVPADNGSSQDAAERT